MANFTIDALLAVLIAFLFISSFGSFAVESTKFQDTFLGNDILVILHKNNTLSSFNSTSINGSLNLLLDTDYRLDVDTYNYSSFKKIGNLSVGFALPQHKEIIVSDRWFYSLQGTRISNFSRARLYIWR